MVPAGADTGVAAIAAATGASMGCMVAIVNREDTPWDPTAVNPDSGAYGLPQFLPVGGVWGETPLGRAGVPVVGTTAEQQLEMLAWALTHGHAGAWAPLPAGC